MQILRDSVSDIDKLIFEVFRIVPGLQLQGTPQLECKIYLLSTATLNTLQYILLAYQMWIKRWSSHSACQVLCVVQKGITLSF